jgi:hypothetical protein
LELLYRCRAGEIDVCRRILGLWQFSILT